MHVCGSFKRFQDPGFKDQFEKKVATVNSHFGLSSGFVLVLSYALTSVPGLYARIRMETYNGFRFAGSV